MPEGKTLRQLSQVFSLFSDATRLKIMSALSLSPMCVGDISKHLSINQTTISHQLKLLKNYNLVTDSRLGKNIVYSLGSDFVCDIMLKAVEFILK